MADRDLNQRLRNDLKQAMKSGEMVARDTIRFTMAAIKNAEIEKGGPLSDAESLALLQRETKRRNDSIEQFRAAGRTDLVESEEAQLAVLNTYLPEPLSDDELQVIVQSAIGDAGATSPGDLGKVMPIAIERVAGRADGKRISTAVREALTRSQ